MWLTNRAVWREWVGCGYCVGQGVVNKRRARRVGNSHCNRPSRNHSGCQCYWHYWCYCRYCCYCFSVATSTQPSQHVSRHNKTYATIQCFVRLQHPHAKFNTFLDATEATQQSNIFRDPKTNIFLNRHTEIHNKSNCLSTQQCVPSTGLITL